MRSIALLGAGLAILGIVAGVVGWWALSNSKINSLLGAIPIDEHCEAKAKQFSGQLDIDQSQSAAMIAQVARQRGLPPRAVTIGLATAMQESGIRNLDYGDRDSLGMFQQRPSQGWGSPAQVQDPVYATNKFFDHLVKVKGYEKMEITVAAQTVQRSAYPDAYAQHESMARAFSAALSGQEHAGLTCVLRHDKIVADADGLAKAAGSAFDGATTRQATNSAGEITETIQLPKALAHDDGAWALASWTVVNAKKYGITEIQAPGQVWRRTTGEWERTTRPKLAAGSIAVTFPAPAKS